MATPQTDALKAVKKLMQLMPPSMVQKFAERTFAKLIRRQDRKINAYPMRKVIAAMPGPSISAKARRLGVTRQAVHQWICGHTRPGPKQAEQLEQLTGIPAAVISGDAPHPNAPPA